MSDKVSADEKDRSHGMTPFTLTQISDQGTSNPIVARLKLGLTDIIQMAQLPDEKRNALKALCYEVGKELLLAERASASLIKELRETEDRVEKEGVKVQNNRVVELPAVLHLDDARTCL